MGAPAPADGLAWSSSHDGVTVEIEAGFFDPRCDRCDVFYAEDHLDGICTRCDDELRGDV